MPEIVEKITRIGNTAVHLAQEENRRKGIPNVYCVNGKIIWQFSDGTITDKPVIKWAAERFHDRYFIIDRKTLVHIGASLNYFGKKCFACSTFDPIDIPELLAKLQM